MSWPENVSRKDLRIEYYRGSGKGGQHKNKRDTACRITHRETGLFAAAEEHKSQSQNKKAAFIRLVDKLVPLMKSQSEFSRLPVEVGRIRTYHKIRQQVIDHRIKDRIWDYWNIIDGNGLGEIIDTLAGQENE
jgi:protein subunit release factor A